ncbi:hypothetical protein PS9374_04261 [Planomonospora sphaerica]|uniref:Uncharacterized protein n=1 Tax=Planomonospora sphaerica TaxID=161355 RepID=A0A171DI00_9ACTN|nr:hypothetical protein PS9374_04261 [Planomonospora sphaerica]
MILDRNNTEAGSSGNESEDLAELRQLLFGTVPGPTEEESLDMFAQTFSSAEADLSLLPGPDVFGPGGGDGDPAPDDAGSGPFGATGPEDDPWDLSGADDPGGHHPDDGHDLHDDSHDGWDPLFGGDV